MKIIDLTPEYYSTYFHCLEDWSEEIQEAGEHKACWYHRYKDKGLRVKLALDDAGTVGGMIQYLPIEHAFVEGSGLYFVLCIWVHGHQQGIGNMQGQGMGQALLAAAEADARGRGARGMAAWGLWLPFWMKASWFKKHGYQKADRHSFSLLVWKPFTADATPPHWIKQQKPVPGIAGKVSVVAFINGWCPAQNTVYERTRRACTDFGEQVVFQSFDTSERQVFLEWGIADGIFINGKPLPYGPPLSYEKIHTAIAKQVKKLARTTAA